MSRRSCSPENLRSPKRRKLEYPPLTPEDYKYGVMLAPMVRSGALPTRLFALKHGAKLVWGPEIVDKAVLHTERVVDPTTGVVSYVGKSKAIFTTHPIEKPFLIYQIGSADPETAVQAAKAVMNDVSGIDLNCGCPKAFSTHAGMGAALLTNPDLLCSILTALRTSLPPEISVSAKIRLLPTQEATLKLVERIVNTGVNCLTVHCRTRDMRPREKALIDRLKEIVEFVEGMGKGIAVIENGDCVSYEDSKRIRAITGAHSCMIATAAEANPTCFDTTPLQDISKTLIPSYIRLCRYLDNHWASTKFCSTQFRGSHATTNRADQSAVHTTIAKAKGYDDIASIVDGQWTGEEEFAAIVQAIEARDGRCPRRVEPEATLQAEATAPAETGSTSSDTENQAEGTVEPEAILKTPQLPQTPDPNILRAPLGPANEARRYVPAFVAGQDVPTPTPVPTTPAAEAVSSQ
ncbi:hypothetical protein EIP86_003545 [Pleurotus ostreatoroseus]|nr:hypothetical protein EIP86_003545 [Pleurotus ostreatoroseus]